MSPRNPSKNSPKNSSTVSKAHWLGEVFVALSSPNVTQQAEFYQAFLLIEPSVKAPSYAEFRLPGMKLAIFEPSSAHASAFSAAANYSSGAMSFCLEVTDLKAAIARITALGYPPPGNIIQASHGEEIYAYDPDSNRLILHQSVVRGR